MAHKKGQGSSRNGRDSKAKRRGIKKFGGEAVTAGNIIARQCGTKWHPGRCVGMGKDFTLFALVGGEVHFDQKSRRVNVISADHKEMGSGLPRAPYRKRKRPRSSRRFNACLPTQSFHGKVIQLDSGEFTHDGPFYKWGLAKPQPPELLKHGTVWETSMPMQDANFYCSKLYGDPEGSRLLVEWFYWHSDFTVTIEWRTKSSILEGVRGLFKDALMCPPLGIALELDDLADPAGSGNTSLSTNGRIQVEIHDTTDFNLDHYIKPSQQPKTNNISVFWCESEQFILQLVPENNVVKVSIRLLPLEDAKSIAEGVMARFPICLALGEVEINSIREFLERRLSYATQLLDYDLGKLE